MNKKFLSAILFGALMVTSTGTFVSCKDYDDDIDAINKELTDVKSQIAALQAKVDAGKWITSASQTAAGVTITLSDGSSLNITNGKDGKDGAQGAAGQDGKNGTVVTVNENGVLCLDGVETAIKVAEEAPAAKPCVKVENDELYVLNAEGEYVASGIKACGVTAVNTNGVWTITVDGESITVPGSAALTSIAIQGEKDLAYTYGYFTTDAEWGWNKEEKAEAGFYSKLQEDVQVLLNPAEADGTAFTYTFRNSVKAVEGITFFGEARPSTTVLTRAASANGVWTLPAAVTKHDATSISELRNELYLNFKQNDKEYYAMSLEAIDGMGNVSTRSDYEYKITLAHADNGVTVDPMNCLVGETYYPVVKGAVIDYKLRVYPTVTNKRKAEAFGLEITEDGKGFIANNESAIFNAITLQVAYVTLNGKADKKTFEVSFANEFTDSEDVRVEEIKKALNATLANNATTGKAPSVIAPYLKSYTTAAAGSKDKVFVIKNVYDLSEMYANLGEEVQLILDGGFSATKDLIGGEAEAGENYNELDRNNLLEEHINWYYNADKKQITVEFYVSNNWTKPASYDADETGMSWTKYSNFQLKTAYQLNLSVIDDLNDTEVAKFELPFEFTQPEIEEVGVSRNTEGTFSKWATHDEYYPAYDVTHHCDVLYLFGSYDNTNMYVPLYDAFNIWTKAPYAAMNVNPNAEYYTMKANNTLEGIAPTIKMSQVSYNGTWKYTTYETWMHNGTTLDGDFKKAIDAQSDPDALEQDKEVWDYVTTTFDFYGVYPATKAQLGYYGEGNSTKAGFRLVYASTIQKSTIETNASVYSAAAGTNSLFISNDDITATTMLGGDFVLFDGVAGKKAVDRAVLNDARGFNEAQRPFVAPESYVIEAKYANGDETDIIPVDYRTNGAWNAPANGKQNASVSVPAGNLVQVFLMPHMDEVPESAVGANDGIAAQNAGLYIVLGDAIEDNQPIELTIRVKDTIGFYNDLKVIVKKL